MTEPRRALDLPARLALALGRLSARWVPSAFAIAVLLTLLTAGLALAAAGASPREVLEAWGSGFWSLLAFAMRMALVMFSGYVVAVAPPVARGLERLAGLPRSPRGAAAFVALASMLLGLLNWGLSIVGSAVLVRHVARRTFSDGRRPDYPLLVACGYFGLGATWHAGLSASAPLVAATAGEPLTQKFGVVPIDLTLLSAFNLGLVLVVVLLLTSLAWLLHPPPGRTRPVDPALLGTLRAFRAPRVETGSPAAYLDHSGLLGLVLGGAGLSYVGLQLGSGGWRRIDLDLVNLTFLSLAFVLHRRPASIVAASEEAASVLSGIVLQFPLYAGIYGIFERTGLTTRVGDLFVRLATPETLPVLVYWYSGLVNYFVPSGGAKWAIEAPYVLHAAQELGVGAERVVLAYAWGDMATDLVQPFWALPLLAVARLEFRDILGYLLVVCAVYLAVVSAAFILWFQVFTGP